jgi:hypothetical protein
VEPLAPSSFLDRARLFLFAAAGVGLPLFAFPIFSLAGRAVDLSTAAAGLFVLVSLPLARRLSRSVAAGLAAAVLVPLLVLVPPLPPRFSRGDFTISYAHWLLVVAFFAAATVLPGSARARRRALSFVVAAGAIAALFAIYQVIGIPRGWPGTGRTLVSFQREPFRFMQVGSTGYWRPTSFFLEPAWLGGFLAFVVALVAGVPGDSARRGSAALRGLLTAVLTVVVLATVSWGSYADLAAAGGVLVVQALARPESRRRLGAGARVFVIVLGLVALSRAGRTVSIAIVERFELFMKTPVETEQGASGLADSTWMRIRNARHTRDLFLAHPARGVGLGQFRRYALEDAPYMIQRATRDPWCGWLAVAAETGVAGPLLIAFPIAVVLFRHFRTRPADRLAAVPALAALAAVMQLHTGSYIDLWWWYPLAAAAVLAGPPPATISSSRES